MASGCSRRWPASGSSPTTTTSLAAARGSRIRLSPRRSTSPTGSAAACGWRATPTTSRAERRRSAAGEPRPPAQLPHRRHVFASAGSPPGDSDVGEPGRLHHDRRRFHFDCFRLQLRVGTAVNTPRTVSDVSRSSRRSDPAHVTSFAWREHESSLELKDTFTNLFVGARKVFARCRHVIPVTSVPSARADPSDHNRLRRGRRPPAGRRLSRVGASRVELRSPCFFRWLATAGTTSGSGSVPADKTRTFKPRSFARR